MDEEETDELDEGGRHQQRRGMQTQGRRHQFANRRQYTTRQRRDLSPTSRSLLDGRSSSSPAANAATATSSTSTVISPRADTNNNHTSDAVTGPRWGPFFNRGPSTSSASPSTSAVHPLVQPANPQPNAASSSRPFFSASSPRSFFSPASPSRQLFPGTATSPPANDSFFSSFNTGADSPANSVHKVRSGAGSGSGSEGGGTTRSGTMTPDLVFAEIGHGRGVNGNSSGTRQTGIAHPLPGQSPGVQFVDPPMLTNNLHNDGGGRVCQDQTPPARGYSLIGQTVSIGAVGEPRPDSGTTCASGSHGLGRPRASTTSGAPWAIQPPTTHRALSPSEDAVDPAVSSLGTSAYMGTDGAVDVRGRSMKRTFRNTLTAVEQHASSFFFGRGGLHEDGVTGVSPMGPAAGSGPRDDGMRGH